MIIFFIYLTIISFYVSQYSLKLKTTHNLEKTYQEVIVNKLKEVDVVAIK
ncbi:conserved hypothetical protein [Staphylococcus sp. 8AQ]|nr:hypothetical protein [Staphylococcus pasteuri]VXC71091.1 conserved hypothetical protein [Staphylococcus sp. 8AQ]